MTAVNINIQQFIDILVSLRNKGNTLINMDMTQDDNNPHMNKLVIYPVADMNPEAYYQHNQQPPDIQIKDPNVSTDNNDIFNLFNGLL